MAMKRMHAWIAAGAGLALAAGLGGRPAAQDVQNAARPAGLWRRWFERTRRAAASAAEAPRAAPTRKERVREWRGWASMEGS